jgi:hypothetical protein
MDRCKNEKLEGGKQAGIPYRRIRPCSLFADFLQFFACKRFWRESKIQETSAKSDLGTNNIF